MKARLIGRRAPRLILQTFLAVVVASVVTVAGMSAGASIAGKQNRSAMHLTGIVSDTSCGSTHEILGNAECTRLCVKLGADYALAVGEKVYVLQGHRAELNVFAGETVVVSGKMVDRNTVAVESVTPYIVWAGL